MISLKLIAIGIASVSLLLNSVIPTATYVVVPEPKLYEEPIPQVRRLIECESGWKNVKIVDTNGEYSAGILQFQYKTWESFSKESCIVGDPMEPTDAIKMANWAWKKGYGYHWSCTRILGLK